MQWKFAGLSHHNWLHQLRNKKSLSYSNFFYFLYVNWAGQMYAGQTGPKESKIQIELNLLVSSFGI